MVIFLLILEINLESNFKEFIRVPKAMEEQMENECWILQASFQKIFNQYMYFSS